jgi:predicted permease
MRGIMLPETIHGLWLRIKVLFRRRKLERDLDDELQFHLAMREEKLAESGVPAEEARHAARRRFGNSTRAKEANRELWTFPLLENLWQDIRYGLRQLRRNPGFAIVAIVTLALGIGANTAIFSVANGIFQRGLPARDPNQLLGLSFHQKGHFGHHSFSYPDLQDIRRQANLFPSLFAYRIGLEGFKMGSRTDQVIASFVTGNYFTTLGLKPALGRLILPSEGKVPGSDPVVVLGYSYWRARFGDDASILGKQVEIDGYPVTIIGVAPKGFRGLLGVAVDVQAYLPINMLTIDPSQGSWVNDRAERSLYIMGRLRPGTRVDQAQASLDVIAERLAQQYPEEWRGASIGTYPAAAANSLYDPSRREYRTVQLAAGLFLGLAGLVLLLACFNVANISMVRARAREHEMRLRAAIGASRSRLMRQVLSESLLLSLLGGAVGLAVGAGMSRALASIHLHVGVPFHLDFAFDWHVFAFAFACASFAGVVMGIVPAVRASRADPGSSLHEAGRGVVPGHHYLRSALVVGQLAGSLVLLVVAGLFVRSLRKASHVELGFNPSHVLNLSMDLGEVRYDDNRGRDFYKVLLDRVSELPHVKAASLAFSFPGSEYSESDKVYVEGRVPPPGQAAPSVYCNSVSPGYFKTMGIPVVEGRGFEKSDGHSAPRIAVINQTMAKDFWPAEDPIGQRFKLSSHSNDGIKVVGIARDSRVRDLTAAVPPYFYLPLDQHYHDLATLQVRTAGPPSDLGPGIEQQIHDLAPGLPVFGVQTMDEALNGPKGFFRYWLGSAFGAGLGLLGLVLTVVGVYGVISYSASQRTREIGIRMALGATPREVLRQVVGEGLRLVAIGSALGFAAALTLTQLMRSLFFRVGPADPIVYFCVALLLGLVASAACYIPARHASRVDPVRALKYE